MTHKTQAAARAAALLSLGEDAKEGLDFVIKHEGAVWTFEQVIPDAATPPPEGWDSADPGPEQGMAGSVAAAQVSVAKKRAPRKTKAQKKPKVLKAKAPAKAPKPGGAPTKSDTILDMLKKPGGATSKEMEEAVGWQPHSVRGFLGGLRKKGIKVVSKKPEGEPATIYSIPKESTPAAAPPPQVGDVL